MSNRYPLSDLMAAASENTHLRAWHLQKVLDFGEPSIQQIHSRDEYQSRLLTLSQSVERDNRFAAFVPANKGRKIPLQDHFGGFLLVTL